MTFNRFAFCLAACLTLSACSNWIYRIDVPQGNFLEQKDIDKLRIDMTKEQVLFVLGKPVVQDAFDKDTWHYLYDLKRGMRKRGEDIHQKLTIEFVDGKLAEVKGDFELSEDFNTPLDQ